jgi:Fe-S cluster biogenesis protein NfuA
MVGTFASVSPLQPTGHLLVVEREPAMDSQSRIRAVLDRVRPLLQADGGDIVLLGVGGDNATVRLVGKCAGCPSSYLTLHLGLEAAIRDEVPEFRELIVV